MVGGLFTHPPVTRGSSPAMWAGPRPMPTFPLRNDKNQRLFG